MPVSIGHMLIARMLIDHMLIAYGLAELVRIAPNVPAARVAGKLALAQDNLGGDSSFPSNCTGSSTSVSST